MSSPLGVTGSGGGSAQGTALTIEAVQRILIQPLEQRSSFLSSGVTIFDSPGGVPIRIPKQAPPEAPLDFIGENEEIPSVSPDFSELTLLPSGMKGVKVLCRFSEELARQSVVSIDQALQSRLVMDVSSTLDATMYASTTTDGSKPTGLLSYASVQTLNVGGNLTLDHILDAWGAAAAAFVDLSRVRLFMRSQTYTALRKIKAGAGLNSYALGGVDATQAVGPNIMGLPVVITDRLPITGAAGSHQTKAVLADMSQVAVARDLSPSVRILSERFADFGQVAIRVEARYDAQPMNPQAIVRLDGITAP